jgi:hypothetical protein
MIQTESKVHSQVCKYLNYQYPKVLFNTDLSGIKLTIGQAKKVKTLRSGRAWPDIFISEPRCGYHGLYLELKAQDVTIVKQNGELVSNEHIQEQYKMMCALESLGYMARFACGFDQAKQIIDEYLK